MKDLKKPVVQFGKPIDESFKIEIHNLRKVLLMLKRSFDSRSKEIEEEVKKEFGVDNLSILVEWSAKYLMDNKKYPADIVITDKITRRGGVRPILESISEKLNLNHKDRFNLLELYDLEDSKRRDKLQEETGDLDIPDDELEALIRAGEQNKITQDELEALIRAGEQNRITQDELEALIRAGEQNRITKIVSSVLTKQPSEVRVELRPYQLLGTAVAVITDLRKKDPDADLTKQEGIARFLFERYVKSVINNNELVWVTPNKNRGDAGATFSGIAENIFYFLELESPNLKRELSTGLLKAILKRAKSEREKVDQQKLVETPEKYYKMITQDTKDEQLEAIDKLAEQVWQLLPATERQLITLAKLPGKAKVKTMPRDLDTIMKDCKVEAIGNAEQLGEIISGINHEEFERVVRQEIIKRFTAYHPT